MAENNKRFMCVRDLCEELQLSRRIVVSLIQAGQLGPSITLGPKNNHLKVLRSDALKYKRRLLEEVGV